MKKLTAGIFATILGVTAMGAASAAMPEGFTSVATTNYVKEAVGAAKTEVSNNYATKQALETAKNTLQGNIDTVSAVANAAAPQATTYTKAQVDAAIAAVDGAASVQALTGRVTTAEGEIDALQTKTEGLGSAAYTESSAYATAAQGTLADSAVQPDDLAAVATSGAYDDLTGKPDLTDMATKTEVASTYATKTDVNTELGKKVDTTTLNTTLADYAKTADVNAELALKATKAELNNYATTSALTTGLAGKQETLSDAQLKAVNSGITAEKIATMDQATTAAQTAADNAAAAAATADGKAVAAQTDATKALGDAAAAKTAADNAQSEVDALETVVAGKADASALGSYVLWTDVDNSYNDDATI